jgi:hypothetical protein
VLRIHPSFRIIALGGPPERENLWVTAEALGIFPFIETLPNLTVNEKIDIVAGISPPTGCWKYCDRLPRNSLLLTKIQAVK